MRRAGLRPGRARLVLGVACAATLALAGVARPAGADRPRPALAGGETAADGDRLRLSAWEASEEPDPDLPSGLDEGDDDDDDDGEEAGESDESAGADEPDLPAGLDDGGDGAKQPGAGGSTDEPDLPEGLGDGGSGGGDGPDLPPGLGDGTPQPTPEANGGGGGGDDDDDEDDSIPQITGFGEYRGGVRVMRDLFQDQTTLSEGRLHLESEYVAYDVLTMRAGADFTYDRDEGVVELREANVSFTPLPFLDIKAGRQILSWGTSTSLFINDLFPKDYFAFLLGRSNDQFKAPSDAVKLSIFTDLASVDVVYVPKFNPDRFLTGDRLSFFNPLMARVTGQDAIVSAIVPDEPFEDDEIHVRLSKVIGGGELAGYGYRGFWKSPAGFDAMTGQFTFPRLEVYGASFRDQIGLGVGHIEAGYYDSIDDPEGSDPFINNSEFRFLAGYERQAPGIADDLTLGFEYYLEVITDFALYESTLPPGFPARLEYRHVIVLQLVKLLYNQNITFQLYGYLSPSDEDVYVRSSLDFRLDDHLTATAGTNLFTGVNDNTFYGQLETNSNVFLAFRYGF